MVRRERTEEIDAVGGLVFLCDPRAEVCSR